MAFLAPKILIFTFFCQMILLKSEYKTEFYSPKKSCEALNNQLFFLKSLVYPKFATYRLL